MLTSLADNCAASLESGLAAMSNSDLSVEVRSNTRPIAHYGKDEVGQTAQVANVLLEKLQGTIASYERARTGLGALVGQVRSAANGLAESSNQLGTSTNQTGCRGAAGDDGHPERGRRRTGHQPQRSRNQFGGQPARASDRRHRPRRVRAGPPGPVGKRHRDPDGDRESTRSPRARNRSPARAKRPVKPPSTAGWLFARRPRRWPRSSGLSVRPPARSRSWAN